MIVRLSVTFVITFLIFQCVRAREIVCHTPVCNRTATLLMEYMDFNVNPCDDFYSFTCGKFLKNYNLPENKMRVSAYQFLDDELNEQLKNVLEEEVEDDAPLFERAAKLFYKSCINTEIIEERGISVIREMIDYFGGWPVVDNFWDERNSNFTDLLVKMKNFAFPELFTLVVYVEESNSTVQLPVVFQPEVTFQLDDYKNGIHTNKINYLRNYMTQVIQLLTNHSSSYQIEQDIDDMLKFEMNLSKILVGPEEMRIKQHRLMTLEEFARKFQNTLQFDVYVKSIFQEADISVQMDQIIELYYPTYIEKLPGLLEKTPRRVVMNYLLWKIINEMTAALPRSFVLLKEEFTNNVYGITGGLPRWKKCISISNEIIPGPVGALYTKKHFRSSAKEKMLNLISELKDAFSNMLSDNLWMTEETKLLAREKANFMKEKIGYPDEYLNRNFYEEILLEARLHENRFFDNWMILRKYSTLENSRHLEKKFSNDSFLMPVANVNSYYLPNLNSIEFPAGILQYPFFNEEMPMYQNFGGIGYVIGHEITHGFDDNGRLYNKDGNAVNWWKEGDIHKFVNLSQCFVDLYNGFIVKEINETVNGRLTLGENIADIGGLKEAFLAYRGWHTKYGADPLIPGFSGYTPEQLFFIHFGQINCMKARPEIERHLIRSDNHSPGEFRVNGAVMNLREFAESFDCPVGAPMNPVDKCHIW